MNMERLQHSMRLINAEVKKAIEENDARTVDHYHLLMAYAESMALRGFLGDLNQPALSGLISYLESKIEYVEEQLATYQRNQH